MNDEGIKTEEYFIVYLDMLGAKERIRVNEDESLKIINQLYSDALSYKRGLLTAVYGAESYAKIFSDNIVVAVKVTQEHAVRQNALFFLSYFASYFQMHALVDHQWLVRGSMTCGNLYVCEKDIEGPEGMVIKSNLIWGSALTTASEVEDKIAIYPRVIADEKILRLGKTDYNDDEVNDDEINLYPDRFSRDEDGLYYLNYLKLYRMTFPHDADKAIQKARKAVISLKKDLSANKSTQNIECIKIHSKIYWTEQYIERVVSNTSSLPNTDNSEMLYDDERIWN